MLAFDRARVLTILSLGVTVLGIIGMLAALVFGEQGFGEQVGCDWMTQFPYLLAAIVLASLPVRLPGSAISLLPAVLLPAWLSCGLFHAAPIGVAAVLVASLVFRTRLSSSWLPSTWLAAATTLAGVILGDLVNWALFNLVPELVVLPEGLVESLPQTAVSGLAFGVGSWLGELAIGWIAARGGLSAEARAVPRASLIPNLLLVFPGIILAEVLASRGWLLFVVLLVILIVALALIALYLSAETARRGAAGERERLESIVSQVPDGIFAVRSDLTLDWLNETAGRLAGVEPDAAAGRPAAEVVRARRTDGSVVDHREAFLEAARTGKTVHREAFLKGHGGLERSVIISYTSLSETPDAFDIGVAAVREIDADDRDVQIADLGHELRSPLTAILGYTGLMLGAAPGSLDQERQAEFLARIAASGDYMLRLVNNLLDLRRMESEVEQLQAAPLQVERLLQLIVAMARMGASEKHVTTTLEVAPNIPPLTTDELLLRRVVDNLVSNAIKYTQPGGSVVVKARRRGDGVEIAVSDTGIGLSADEQKQLYQRFFRSRRPEARKERGTGLGLALVRESVRRLGGEITVTSEVGVGSTFTVWIPPLAPPEVTPKPAPVTSHT